MVGESSTAYRKCSCIECLISAPEVCLRIDGVVGPTARFAGAVLVWIAGAICTRTCGTQCQGARGAKRRAPLRTTGAGLMPAPSGYALLRALRALRNPTFSHPFRPRLSEPLHSHLLPRSPASHPLLFLSSPLALPRFWREKKHFFALPGPSLT